MKIPKARKLPSGSWFIQLRLGGESVPITANTERECVRQASYVKSEYLVGKRTPKPPESPSLPTLSKAIDQYLTNRSNVLSPSTIRGYRTIQDNRFKALMSRSISDITDEEWVAAFNAEAALCAPKTLVSAWSFVSSVLRQEYKITLPEVKRPQVPPNERPFLDAGQIQTFLKATEGSKYRVEILLALSSLRRSEIGALQWSQVDLPRRRIFVKGALVPDENNEMVLKQSNKNRSSTRYVPIMMDELYQALLERESKTGPVCTCHVDTIRREINRLCAQAGLPEVSTHGLRHSFASLAYHLRVPEKVTMEIGGWADDKTMKKIYTHIAQADVERYEKEFSNFFNPSKSAEEGPVR